ncbi:MAG: peptidyl-prolyl cis-trans isomerase [Candidatus Pacebacteria bacterium]|nr:peptidyl-prolyl cis-trans isomerase [Candidatus Paceibacterota bacterium]
MAAEQGADDRIERQTPIAVMQTSLGTIEIELFPEDAPGTVRNFINYVEEGFYDHTIFHRVIPGFMIQAGGLSPDMKPGKTRDPIRNEADNGLRNERGTLAMARTQAVHSATAQFFINLTDNHHLDPRPGSFGYAVFGKVIRGMQVVDRIAAVPTVRRGMHASAPKDPVMIESLKMKKAVPRHDRTNPK